MEEKSLIYTEVKEVFSTYRTQYTLMTQLITVLIIGNITVIGFILKGTLDNNLFAFGALFPVLILIVRIKTNKEMIPIIYSAVHLEKMIGGEADWVISTYIETIYPHLWKQITSVTKEKDKKERIKKLKKICNGLRMIFEKNNLLITTTCLLSAIIQLIISVCFK